MVTGFWSTLLLPETKGLSLEELSNEKQEGFLTGRSIVGWLRRMCTEPYSSPGIAGRAETVLAPPA
jgi:hypothetical protein